MTDGLYRLAGPARRAKENLYFKKDLAIKERRIVVPSP